MKHSLSLLATAVATTLLAACSTAMPSASGKPEFMLVGMDTKAVFAEDGALNNVAPGKDVVTIVDIGTDPASEDRRQPAADELDLRAADQPRRSRPTASSRWSPTRWTGRRRRRAGKPVPDNKLYVIDLTTNPPKLIDTVAVGKQPSGMSINRAGNLALIANRADNSISVLSIAGKKVKLVDTRRDGRAGRARRRSRPTASARWRRSSPATRSRCSTSTARR